VTAAPEAVLVLGDSVPGGAVTSATAWPRRVADRAGAALHTRGSMGTTMVDLADGTAAALREALPGEDREGTPGGSGGGAVALVHAGHNDAQLRGDEPRVAESEFRAAARTVDERLTDAAAVDRHAFLGLVPLLSLESGGVGFSDAQPDRSLDYDRALGETVSTHLPVAQPVEAWRERTADGVHPNEAGHAALADRVTAWLEDGRC
jgi:lysophospholipase L1-like esterase